MSAYRHSMSAVQRSKQRSATGAAAYRSGTKLVDVRTGAEYDYTRRRGVAAAHVIVPGAAGIDAVDRQALWAAVEKKHTRGDAVPAREVVASLPCELDPIDRHALALRYARHFAETYGVAVDIAVHLPSIKPGHDARNHHFHMLFSACTVHAEADGLLLTCGKKVEALDPIASRRRGGEPIAEVERAVWARMCNEALAAAGHADVVVDHRSYERQGVDQIPQIHLGPAAHDQLLAIQRGVDLVPLDRVRQYLRVEQARGHLKEAQRLEAEVARLEAEVIVMPPPEPRPDAPIKGPAAVVVPIRPEPPPAPSTDVVLEQIARLWAAYGRADRIHDDGRDGWDALRAMDRNGWRPDAPGLRAVLEKHPALRREWSAEITSREPEIAAAEQERRREQREIRRQAVRAIMSLVPRYPAPEPSQGQIPSQSGTDSEHPAPVPVPRVRPVPAEPEPERKQLPAVVSAELPVVVRGRAELDVLIADAAARLAALEEREHRRRQAAEAYRLSQAALREAQSGLWARLRSFVGLGPAPAEKSALAAVRAAEQAAKAAGASITFGKVVLPSGDELAAVKSQLVVLRDERSGLVATAEAAEQRTRAAIDQVITLVQRADLVVPVEQRADWPALCFLDEAGGIEKLRSALAREPGVAVMLGMDLTQRRSEIERLELERQRGDEAEPDWPAPGM